jgi:hypothetical protein
MRESTAVAELELKANRKQNHDLTPSATTTTPSDRQRSIIKPLEGPVIKQDPGLDLEAAVSALKTKPTAGSAGTELKQIRIPLDGVGLHAIEVRLKETAGQVQVSVHSPRPDLREALREDLPVLVGSLEKHGVSAESRIPPSETGGAEWRPEGSGESPREPIRAVGASEFSGSDPNSGDASERRQNQQGREHRDQMEQHQRQAKNGKPDWKKALEEHIWINP